MDFADHPLWLIFVVSLVAVIAAVEIGRWFGLLAGSRGREDFSAVEGAILGLLALMIGFTFAMALSRFDARRDAVLNEANAIGTTALRARLLPAPHNTECLKLLREYAQIRLDITRRAQLRRRWPPRFPGRMPSKRRFGNRSKPWRRRTTLWSPRGFSSRR